MWGFLESQRGQINIKGLGIPYLPVNESNMFPQDHHFKASTNQRIKVLHYGSSLLVDSLLFIRFHFLKGMNLQTLCNLVVLVLRVHGVFLVLLLRTPPVQQTSKRGWFVKMYSLNAHGQPRSDSSLNKKHKRD